MGFLRRRSSFTCPAEIDDNNKPSTQIFQKKARSTVKPSFSRLSLFLWSLTLLLLLVVVWNQHHVLGPGTLAGGLLGKTFDNGVRKLLWSRQQRRLRKDFLRHMGYSVPTTKEKTNRVGVPVVTESWLRQSILAAWQRQLLYVNATNEVTIKLDGNGTKTCATLPLIQPLVGDWYRPVESLLHDKNTTQPQVVWVDESTMDAFMYLHYSPLVSAYQKLALPQRAQLWALCHVAMHGGHFVGPTRQRLQSSFNNAKHGGDDCTIRLRFESDSLGNLDLLQAPPNHPYVACVVRFLMERASQGYRFEWKDVVAWLASLAAQEAVNITALIGNDTCVAVKKSRIPFRSVNGVDADADSADFGPIRRGELSRNRWEVKIRETSKAALSSTSKKSWSRQMKEVSCFPGWLCNRCLRLPWLGSHSSCRRWFCPACYRSNICSDNEWQARAKKVDLEVHVLEARNQTDAKRIPAIIHQTWFEELNAGEYPHLQRLQNSWKSMNGWDYRFYTDESARKYIRQHMPARLLDAYDAILVPAFKADFFRLCVLTIHGGVYADIDVMLETNLDYFITSNLSFFVPRDVNIDMWPGANYCVWNGIMGSSPGHPIIVKALEDLVNRALQREDYFDVELNLCGRSLSIDIWKLRCSPMLLVTGPCALGIALNDALGRDDPLRGLDVGWQLTDRLSARHGSLDYGDWGHVLVLLLDRYDLREQRFTDVGRNLLLASTNQDRIATRPIHDVVSEHKHYSSYESDIVGSRAYRDDQVSVDRVRLQIHHQYV